MYLLQDESIPGITLSKTEPREASVKQNLELGVKIRSALRVRLCIKGLHGYDYILYQPALRVVSCSYVRVYILASNAVTSTNDSTIWVPDKGTTGTSIGMIHQQITGTSIGMISDISCITREISNGCSYARAERFFNFQFSNFRDRLVREDRMQILTFAHLKCEPTRATSCLASSTPKANNPPLSPKRYCCS